MSRVTVKTNLTKMVDCQVAHAYLLKIHQPCKDVLDDPSDSKLLDMIDYTYKCYLWQTLPVNGEGCS